MCAIEREMFDELISDIEQQLKNGSLTKDYLRDLISLIEERHSAAPRHSLFMVYNKIASASYVLDHPLGVVDDRVEQFRNVGYFVIETDLTVLKQFWDALDTPVAQLSFSDRSLVPHYTTYDGPTLTNQFHINQFSKEMLSSIEEFLGTLNLYRFFHSLFTSNIGIANVRCWKYINGVDSVLEHRDVISPECKKIMIFRGDVTEDSGCLQLYSQDKWIHVVGKDIVLLCDTQLLLHKALAPTAGLERKAIELTICPRIEDDNIIVHAGWQAGSPVNPFKSWR
jgi:hypothetical protein